MERVITEADEGPSDSPILRFHRRREAGLGDKAALTHLATLDLSSSIRLEAPAQPPGRPPRYPRHLGGTELQNLNYLRNPSSKTTRRGSMNINVCQRGEGGGGSQPPPNPFLIN